MGVVQEGMEVQEEAVFLWTALPIISNELLPAFLL